MKYLSSPNLTNVIRTIPEDMLKKLSINFKKAAMMAREDTLLHFAFDSSLQANIIFTAGSGKIIMANNAACKLLGYSKKELLIKNRRTIFNIHNSGIKKVLDQRGTKGQSTGLVTVKKKSGEQILCKLTSAVFLDADGIEKAITTITDMSRSIRDQKIIDTQKEKIVASNIGLAKSKQKEIDSQRKVIMVRKIVLARSKQKEIDTQKKIIVYRNINLAISKQKKIDTKKEKIVAHNIVQARSKQKKMETGMKKIVAHNILLAKSKQKKIDTKKEKIVGNNIILAQAKSDARLAKNNEEHSKKFNMAAKLSFDGIWDWNLLTNEFFLGEGFEELFGYAQKKTTTYIADWRNYLHPEDKKAVEKGLLAAIGSSATHWSHGYRLIKADGSVAKVFGRATIIRDANKKGCRMIGAIHDLSRQKELEDKLQAEIEARAEYKASVKLILNSSSDVLIDVDLEADEIMMSDAYEKEFGYAITSNMKPEDDWFSHIHPDDKEEVMQDYQRMLMSDDTEWKYSYRFLRADDTVANVTSSRIVLRNADGKAYRMIGSIHDISKQKVLEERLEQEIKLKESQIAQAAEDAKDTERSDIGKELHDNVNQLLAVSKLYLDMAKRGGENSEMYLARSSEYTLTAIEEIRKLTRGLTTDIVKNLGLFQAIDTVTRDTMEVNPVKISCLLESFVEHSVNDKFKLNVYRIMQEQLNNILKHAKATEVTISLSQINSSIILSISDNGVGFDAASKREGIGVENIKSRAASYKGTADFVSQPGQGCVLNVIFPVTDALLNKNGIGARMTTTAA